jgi:hypothetical protein
MSPVAVGCPLTAAAVRSRRTFPVGLSVRRAGGRVIVAHVVDLAERGGFRCEDERKGEERLSEGCVVIAKQRKETSRSY